MKLLYTKLLIISCALHLMTTSMYAQEETTTMNRIMPLGDSLTYDYRLSDSDSPRPTSVRTGYRSHLWYMLKDANLTVNFVGSKSAGEAITPAFDTDNEGHIGWSSYELAEHTYGYMTASYPDTVLLHIGTNDISSSVDGVASVLNQINLYENLSGKNVKVFVALIVNTRENSNIINTFNKNLTKLLDTHMLSGDSVILVDMANKARLTSADYADDIHPNDTGYQKMATVWFNALTAPYTPTLYTFPSTVVNTAYITAFQVYENEKKVEFTTKVPEDGIKF